MQQRKETGTDFGGSFEASRECLNFCKQGTIGSSFWNLKVPNGFHNREGEL